MEEEVYSNTTYFYIIGEADKSQIYMKITLIYLVFCIVYHLFLGIFIGRR